MDTFSRAHSQDLPAWEVLRCFKMISDDTCRALGLNPAEAHPEWFIQTVWIYVHRWMLV